MRSGRERWSSRFGVILAVAGSAVGLGNFLRFPGQAAQYGGGSFMLAYFISLLIIGIPICWAEWVMGRYAGERGFNSAPGAFHAFLKHPAAKYIGVIGVIIPVVIYMYYVVIEAWCLGYAVNFLTGRMNFQTAADSTNFFKAYTGVASDGLAIGFKFDQVGDYIVLVFILNFFLIYRGLAKGIEWFCKWAMPALVFLAIVILVRVLTLGTPDPARPDLNVSNGLGFMWNPTKVVVEKLVDGAWTKDREVVGRREIDAAHAEEAAAPDTIRVRQISILDQLKKPDVWLAAAGQIFFSLSVGFGVILTYASYLSRRDDVVLSGLSATSANEFCEVGLGGLITVPAAVTFLGIAGAAGQGTFALGFNVLPLVFAKLPVGWLFGFVFFFLLFLAAITSSLSMLQPGIAFLEESLQIGRKQSVAILGLITSLGSGFVVWFSKDLKALDTLDFWVGTFLIFLLATIQIITFAWVFGVDRGLREAHRGASIHIPWFFKPVIQILCPAFLLVIFVLWVAQNMFGLGIGDLEPNISSYVTDLAGEKANPVAIMSVGIIVIFGAFVALLVNRAPAYRQPIIEPAEDNS